MKIRVKIVVILIGTLLVLNAMIFIVAQGLIMTSYTRLEISYMQQSIQRTLAALDDRLEKMDYTVHDWASWTETYEFLAGNNPAFIAENFMESAFVSLNIDLVALFDASGALVYEKAIDEGTGLEMPVPAGFREGVEAILQYLAVEDGWLSRTGIVMLPDHGLLVALRPVLTSMEEGPAAGTMVMASFFDNGELGGFGDITRLPLSMDRIDASSLPVDVSEALDVLSGDDPVLVRIVNTSSIKGYALIPDMLDRPALVIGVEAERDIHASGLRTMWYFTIMTIMLSFVVGLTIWVLLRNIVIKRLTRLGTDAANIRLHGNLSERLEVTGDDELSDVTRALNAMLEALKRNQVRLQQAQRYEAQGKLAGGTAHEFNNILAIILGSIEMVIGSLPEPHPERTRLERARRAGLRGKDIVGRILDFSLGSRQPRSWISLSDIVPAALDMMQALFPPGLTLVRRIAGNTGAILANPGQIEQIVTNLCKNAREAIGDRSGTVEILVEEVVFAEAPARLPDLPPGTYVRLRVSDTGMGMLPSERNQIFDPFFTTKKIGEGYGLGLSVVLGIVQQHGGWIDVDSEKGKGASFDLLFPVVTEGQPELPSLQEEAEELRAGHVLMVGVNPTEYSLPATALEALGYRISFARNAAEALSLSRAEPVGFRAILVDAGLEDMAAITLCRSIHEREPESILLLCINAATETDPDSLRNSGITCVMRKPLTVRAVIENIEQSPDRSYC